MDLLVRQPAELLMIRWWHRRQGHTQQMTAQWWDFSLLTDAEVVICSCGKRWVLLGDLP